MDPPRPANNGSAHDEFALFLQVKNKSGRVDPLVAEFSCATVFGKVKAC